ncbi:MAG: hypothetical protein HXX16_09835 [Bacteroidales bacterium]|nr:hypothetical protein [Bacteroidales bacterium]
MKRTNVIFAASLLVFATSFSACQKSETTDPLVDSSQDDDQVTALYDNVQSEADEVSSAAAKSPAESADYAMLTSGSGTRTVVKSFSGDTIVRTITFASFINGNSLNGHVKNGVIVVKVLGGPLLTQFVKIVTLQNFTIDGNKIEGKTVTTKTGEHKYSEVLTGGKITLTDGTTYTRAYTHTRTWTAGFDTPLNIWDDVYTIEGNASGVNRKGNTYTHTITNPLVIENDCRWIVQGTIELASNGKTATIDYGMGTCDDMATITINGKTTDIKIKTKR